MSSPAGSPSSSLRIRSFDNIPSAEEFISQIEPQNVPAVFRGCINNWKAFSKWNISNGGLDYLQETAGSSNVEAMLSRTAPVFNGDIRSHERVSLPFSTFIGYCKDVLQSKCSEDNTFLESKKHSAAEFHDEPCSYPQQIYLAQVSATGAVPLEKSNHQAFPRAEHFKEYAEKVTLHAGDALFLPEGWYHQVDSECLTIAVNIWWRSDMMYSLLEHMDSYYLRRILRSFAKDIEKGSIFSSWFMKHFMGEFLTLWWFLLGSSDRQNQMLHMPSVTSVVDANWHGATVNASAGAEVLTRKFEEMDRLIGEDDRNQFYQIFYGVFDDPFAAMEVLLNGKESFSRQAYKHVIDQHLGIDFGGSKPSVS
ncbi:hypothetical protein M9H77_01445 [Catharanthus roseus]|uniref:Uncharacterized protein n=1 Tax=Catharanthus roseus TaxID=4058 RepID=A0ACC0C618_CATRO|nr:hypothetical protein M9H77_01445 [Catharanthus roseus]